MVRYEIAGNILAIVGAGTYTTEEIAAALSAAKNDPSLPSPVRLLIDISRSDMVHSLDDVRARLELIRQHFGRTQHVAFVASGVARMRLAEIYQRRAQDAAIQVAIFSERIAAENWLHQQER